MIDIVLLGVIALSALLGLFRGFVGIVVGTLSWLLAGWATFQFGGMAGRWLAAGNQPSTTESVGGYALVFVGVLVLVAVVGMLIRAGVDAVRLNGTDRLLGFALGLVRGVFLGCVLVLLAGFTPLAREPAWDQSRLLPLLRPGADWMRAQLPAWSVPQVDLGKLPIAGDNGRLDQVLPLSSMEDAVMQALPSSIEPAQARAGVNDPVPGEHQGQVRPSSQ